MSFILACLLSFNAPAKAKPDQAKPDQAKVTAPDQVKRHAVKHRPRGTPVRHWMGFFGNKRWGC